MGYINNVTGYRDGLLSTRSIIRRGNFALLEPDGLVQNRLPGFEGCQATILASPKLGASFVDYLLTVQPGGGNREGFGTGEEEVFFTLLEGELTVGNEDGSQDMRKGGYLYNPPGKHLFLENKSGEAAKGFLYKRLYDRIEGHEPHAVAGNIDDVPFKDYEGMADVRVKDFLPAADDLAFDMNFHILSFRPGASHGYIETHFQEHGAYVYSGEGMYVLDDQWLPVQKGDYLFMGAYCPQACYAVGRDEEFAYIYSKDCNRDVRL
ncbi:MAG: (S)-ureidoglycine aminohydrolase [Clostridiales Family XIII bacterium]|jgi:(S)-ureidoglycine aminohydrolase|nr:(S)-ureidoglycine aminohydrolase [Clostridiales Family XIII bacterium]